LFKNEDEETHKINKTMELYEQLFNVDYSQHEEELDGRPAFFQSELSFSFLNWYITEKVLTDREF